MCRPCAVARRRRVQETHRVAPHVRAESFGRVVDLIEERRFSPPGLEVLKAPSRPDGKTPFAQDVCLNCDARFGCASYRQLVRAQSPGRSDQALRDASADFGGDAEKQDWRDSGVTATARIDVEDEEPANEA